MDKYSIALQILDRAASIAPGTRQEHLQRLDALAVLRELASAQAPPDQAAGAAPAPSEAQG